MSRRKKTGTGFLNSFLLLLLMVTLFKIGGMGLVMILFTVVIGFGAIYLSGEPLSGIFRKRINVSSLDELIKLNPYQFERVVGDCFRDYGYVVHQTKKSGDGGKDLVMFKGGQTYYVECKRYAKSNTVGRPLVQKLVGACHPVGAKPIFVTTSTFTAGAIKEAERSGAQLIDGKQLLKMINSAI